MATTPLPFEFTVTGPPFSHQTHNKPALAKWRSKVRAAAKARLAAGSPVSIPIWVGVVYYHAGDSAVIDPDNMVKPILDAMNGLVFADDTLVTDAQVRKTPIDAPVRVRFASPVLLSAFSTGEPFVHVMVAERPDHTTPVGVPT